MYLAEARRTVRVLSPIFKPFNAAQAMSITEGSCKSKLHPHMSQLDNWAIIGTSADSLFSLKNGHSINSPDTRKIHNLLSSPYHDPSPGQKLAVGWGNGSGVRWYPMKDMI